MSEKIQPDEFRKVGFFDRSAHEVIRELTERIYKPALTPSQYEYGQAKHVLINGKSYTITLAESYLESNPGQAWKGKRLDELCAMQPGELIVYPSQYHSRLPFISLRGGDNIQIRGLRDDQTDEAYGSSTAVANILGLEPGQRGRLTLVDDQTIRFDK